MLFRLQAINITLYRLTIISISTCQMLEGKLSENATGIGKTVVK